jgi:class 3 adenylate cyclase
MVEIFERWRRLRLTLLVGNLVGAVVTFCYLRFIDQGANVSGTPLGAWELAYSVAAFAILIVVGSVWMQRWGVPLLAAGRGQGGIPEAAEPLVRRRALLVPYMLACVTFTGWIGAGFFWGVLWPTLTGGVGLRQAARLVFGITVVAGSVSTALVFLAAERQWRRALPRFFPRGDVSGVAGAVRLPVRTRLLVSFLLISIIPLAILGVVAYTRAIALLGTGPAAATGLVDELRLIIVFLVAVGILAAVGLASFTAHSVADPLGQLERAMSRVGRGELEARCPVVANDEIGAATEGFNRMLEGLREREVIRETFGKYVTREVRDEILAGRVGVEGRVEEVTILFADLRDFTPWVERTAPREVVQDLNEYFTAMEAAIRAHGGLVLQYIGDEIEAVFGAPLRAPDHAGRALAAAREMRHRLAALNERRAAAGRVALRNGIGVHTGAVLAGNIGSAERLTYSLVGDAVNLASRIQGLNKELGTDILVSEATRRALTDGVGLEAMPALRVKGKSVEVSVYRVL